MPKRVNVVGGKNRPALTNADKKFLRDALHTEGALSGDYALAVSIRQKLGLGKLALEGSDDA